jgi:hypothetical protein
MAISLLGSFALKQLSSVLDRRVLIDCLDGADPFC